MNSERFVLRCDTCSMEYGEKDVLYTCPRCGFPDGTLTLIYSFSASLRAKLETFSTRRGIFRFEPLLPVERPETVFPLIGDTPLLAVPSFYDRYGIKLFLKDDTRNPSASLKDRASIIGIIHAKKRGAEVICAASTGNAAASLSLLATPFKLPVVIFVPQTIPQAKLAQILSAGARVVKVKGSYDDAYELSMKATERWGWYSRNTGFNPYLGEGKKSVSLEIWDELMNRPDHVSIDAVLVPTGDGCIIGAVYKGFKDLEVAGLIERVPRIYGIQSEGCRPFVDAFEKGLRLPEPCTPTTIADSISVNMPKDPLKALRAVRESGGKFIAVPDQEILSAIYELASNYGLFSEPAGAASYAGLKRLIKDGEIRPDDTVVCLITGSGLKDIDSVIKATPRDGMVESEPDIAEVERVIKKMGFITH